MLLTIQTATGVNLNTVSQNKGPLFPFSYSRLFGSEMC